jgi:hypothetical protein
MNDLSLGELHFFTPVDARAPNPKSLRAAKMVSWEPIYNATARTDLRRAGDEPHRRALHNKFIAQHWSRCESPVSEKHTLSPKLEVPI